MLFCSGLENSVCFNSRQYLNTRLFFVFFVSFSFHSENSSAGIYDFQKENRYAHFLFYFIRFCFSFFLKRKLDYFCQDLFWGFFILLLKKASYMRAFQARRSLKLSFRLQLTSMFTLDRINRTAWSLFANRIISLYKHHHHHLLYQ